MSNYFGLKNSNAPEFINIDELYEKKKKSDLGKLDVCKRMLARAHEAIRISSRMSNDNCCWFEIPSFIIGVSKYDQAGCIAYLLDKLISNKLDAKYFHPNYIFISWNHLIPTYIRNEYKTKTGLTIDEYGNVKSEDNEEEIRDPILVNSGQTESGSAKKTGKQYEPISNYKPLGNLIYDPKILERIDDISISK